MRRQLLRGDERRQQVDRILSVVVDDGAHEQARALAIVGQGVVIVLRDARVVVQLAVRAVVVHQLGLHQLAVDQHVGKRRGAERDAVERELPRVGHVLQRLAELGDEADHAVRGDHVELQQLGEIDELDRVLRQVVRVGRRGDRRVARARRIDAQK